jgi:hypothetical protein
VVKLAIGKLSPDPSSPSGYSVFPLNAQRVSPCLYCAAQAMSGLKSRTWGTKPPPRRSRSSANFEHVANLELVIALLQVL